MVTYEPELVKGFPEFLPPESQKFEKVREVVEEGFKRYGFLPIKTPSVEFDELMRPDNIEKGDEAVSDRFRFQDRGGRNLGLRYEFTFQLARIFKRNPNIKMPFRRYQVGSVFRDEPTTGARFREFTQCDVDIIGDNSINADAECLALASDVFSKLGIETEIQINNRKLIGAIIESARISDKGSVMRELDKMDKIGEDAVKTNLKKYADSMQIVTLFKLLEKDIQFFAKNLFEGAEDVLKLQQLGKTYGFKTKFEPTLMRGLSYYTGNIFEVRTEGGKESLAGGGRYDRSVGKFLHREIPAVGISFGIERVVQFADVKVDKTEMIIISLGKMNEAVKLCQKLRGVGARCIVMDEKPGKALEYANSYNIENAVFVGEEEMKKKKFKLKNLETGNETYLTEKQMIQKFSK